MHVYMILIKQRESSVSLSNTLMGHPLATPVLISHYSIWMWCRVRHLTSVSLFVWERVFQFNLEE